MSDEGTEAARLLGMNPTRDLRTVFVIALALIAMTLKLAIAYNTIGTNDAVFFYGFAKVLNEHGLEWTYAHSRSFNHPPLTAYYLNAIYMLTERRWCQDVGIHFPFLLRFPGIVADFLVVLVLLQFRKIDIRIPTWAVALFAISPVSLMVSGFHGNTDPIMVLFLVCAVWMGLRNRPALCGLCLALSCQIKIIPLLLVPVFLFFWLANLRALRFTVSFVVLCAAMWIQPLIEFPGLFFRNVLSYGSYWGVWGITYCLRMTGSSNFNGTGAFNLPFAPALTAIVLRVSIVAAVVTLAFHRRQLGQRAVITSIALAWIIFFVLSPGVCVQYLVWPAPFLLLSWPRFYGWVTAASSIFAFIFYNTIAGGLPWSVALSTDKAIAVWVPWSLLLWLVLLAGLIIQTCAALRKLGTNSAIVGNISADGGSIVHC